MTHSELVKLLDILDRIDNERDKVEDMRGGVDGGKLPYPTAFNNDIISQHLSTRAEYFSNFDKAAQILKVSSLSRINNWIR